MYSGAYFFGVSAKYLLPLFIRDIFPSKKLQIFLLNPPAAADNTCFNQKINQESYWQQNAGGLDVHWGDVLEMSFKIS